MSYAMLLTAYWLMFRPWGDDDEPILGTGVDEEGKSLENLSTESRVRLADSSAAGMAVGTALRMFGADTENNDHWVRMRTMPYATQAMAFGAALRYMTHPTEGSAKSAMSDSWNMVEDFMSIGSGAQIGLAFLGFRDDYNKYQDTSFIASRGIFDMVTGRVLPPRLLKDIASLVDPIDRRYTKSETLDYFPGVASGVASKIPGLTKFLPPAGKVTGTAKAGGEKANEARAFLAARGLDRGYRERIDKEGNAQAAYVRPEKITQVPPWKAAIRQTGFNVKPIPKKAYQESRRGD